MRSGLLMLSLVCSVYVACSGNRDGTSSLRDRNLITAEEISAARGTNAWDIVEELRPVFLQARGPRSVRLATSDLPVVYLDGVRMGPASELRTIAAISITSIRFLSAADATTRWGTGHSAGVIHVRTYDQLSITVARTAAGAVTR